MNIIYLRRSGNKQEITIDSQLKEITGKGYTPDKVFSDTISGSSEVHKRQGLVQSLNEINKGDKFIVHSYDRLSRDVMIFGFIDLLKILTARVSFVFFFNEIISQARIWVYYR